MINNKTFWKRPQLEQVKQMQVDKLQLDEIDDLKELSDSELMAVVGGGGGAFRHKINNVQRIQHKQKEMKRCHTF